MQRRGFTLVELLVVVGIIALLASLIIPSLGNARLKAQDAKVRRQAAELRIVMARELNDTGSYSGIL